MQFFLQLPQKFGKDQVRLQPAGLPQINNSPHVGPEPHGSARVRLVLADEDGVRDREQPHQCAVLQELEDLRFISETPAKRQIRNTLSMSHRHLQNCCNTNYQSKQIQSWQLWPPRAHTPLIRRVEKGSDKTRSSTSKTRSGLLRP